MPLSTSGRAVARPYPWVVPQIPGIDYPVGRTNTVALKVPGVDAMPTGATFSTPKITVTGNNVVFLNWDLRGFWLEQTTGANTQITQCVLNNAVAAIPYAVVYAKDMKIDNCSIYGVASPSSSSVAFVGPVQPVSGNPSNGNAATLIFEFNYSEKAPQRHVCLAGGAVRYNQFVGTGYVTGSKGDGVRVVRNNFTGMAIHENNINMLPCPNPATQWGYPIYIGSEDDHNAQTTPGKGNTFGVDVHWNITLGGVYSIFSGDQRYLPLSGVSIQNNWCDLSHVNTLGYLAPDHVGSTLASHFDLLTGSAFTAPPGDISNLAATGLSSSSVQLTFTNATSATSYEYSYSTDGVWDLVGGGGSTEAVWTALAGDKIVPGVTGADTKYWRVRGVRTGTGSDSGTIVGNESNIALATPASVSVYPAAVVSAGAQAAWDIAPNGIVDRTKAGPRIPTVPLTSLNLPSGWSLATANVVKTISHSPALFSGLDTGGRSVWIEHNFVTMRDCYCTVQNGGVYGPYGIILAPNGTSNLHDHTIEYCYVDGLNTDVMDNKSSDISRGVGAHAGATGLNNFTFRFNIVSRTGDDELQIRSGNALIERNFFERGGMAYGRRAHWDGVAIENVTLPGVVIQDNFISCIPGSNTFGRTSSIPISTVQDVTIRRNILHYGAEILSNGWGAADTNGDLVIDAFEGNFGAPAPGYYSMYAGFIANEDIKIYNNVCSYNIAAMSTSGNGPYGVVEWHDNYRLSGTPALDNTLIAPIFPIDAAFFNIAGPYVRWHQEGAQGGAFTTWQSKFASTRLDNRLWDDTSANYGYGAALLVARLRGNTTTDYDGDAAAFINDYMADIPGGNANEAHKIVWDMYFSYLLNKANAAACLTWLNSLDFITWHFMDNNGSPALNLSATDYTARNMFKHWDNAMVLRLINNVNYDWPNRTQIFRDACVANQNSNGGWPAYDIVTQPNRQSKFFQNAGICRSAMFYYDQFEQHPPLLDAIRKAAAHAWRHVVQKSGAGFLQNGQPYMDAFTTGEFWNDGNNGTVVGNADLLAQWLDVFGWLAHKDQDQTWITRADTWMATWNASAYVNNTTASGIKNYDEAYATWSWRYSYWKGTTRNTTLKPRATAVPTISGTASVGSTLTFNSGTWVNGGTSTFEIYRVKAGNAAGSGFIKLTKSSPTTYVLVSADIGCFMFVEETRNNASGDGVPAISLWTAAVT